MLTCNPLFTVCFYSKALCQKAGILHTDKPLNKEPSAKIPRKEPFAKLGPASLKSSLKSCKESIHTGPSAKGPSLRGRPALTLFHSRKEPFAKRLSKKPSHDLKWVFFIGLQQRGPLHTTPTNGPSVCASHNKLSTNGALIYRRMCK